jgi:fatty acid-binding protein DegV
MPVAIVSDTCHYLPSELVAANGIHEVSLYVHRDAR